MKDRGSPPCRARGGHGPTLVLPRSLGPGRCARRGGGGKGGAGAIACDADRRPCGRHHDVDTDRPRERSYCHLIRSRMQLPFTTCKLSVDVPNLRVHVHGRPWSFVAVDVPTDVDRRGPLVAPLTGRLSATKHLILGQVLFHQPLSSDHGSCMLRLGGIPSARRSPADRLRTRTCWWGAVRSSGRCR